jgi:hypothetical protein
MRLRPVNLSRRAQLAGHEFSVRSVLERHDESLSDRHGDGPIQRLRARLFAETLPANLPDVPDRDIGSWQSVKIFRPVTFGDTVHPLHREFFEPDELAAVHDEAAIRSVISPESYRHIDYVDNSEHAALVGFQTEGQEKGDREHQAKIDKRNEKRKRRAERAGYKVAQDLAEPVDEYEAKKARAEAEKWAGVHRELSAEIRDRLRFGFFYPGASATGGGKIAGEIVGKFSEFFGEGILRSRLGSPSLARMAALYPKVGHLRAGYDKEALLTTTSKLFALDAPYVELNRKVAGCIVVDLDSVLRVAEFREALLALLGPRRMPNLIVGRITRDGFLSRPHLIWILKKPVWYEPYYEWTDPDTGEVRSSGDKRCKTKPIAKFNNVQRGLTQLLLPLGADPACHNIWKPKNPLSPFWTTIVANDDTWHELGDFDQIKGWPERVDEHALEEAAAKMRAEATGATPSASNLAWKTIGHEIEPLARLQLSVRDTDFVAAGNKGVDALAAWFEAKVGPVAEKELGPSAGLDRILARRCDFAARYCLGKLAKRGRRKGRGRDRDLIFSDMTTEARKQQAGARTAEHKRAVCLWQLQREIHCAIEEIGAIRRPEFMKTLWGIGKTAAYKHWDEACLRLGIEFRDGAYRKKAKPTSGQNGQPSPSIQSNQSPDSAPSTVPVLPSCGYQVQTHDSVRSNPVIGPPEAGPPDPPWENHVLSSAEMRPAAATCVLEPV